MLQALTPHVKPPTYFNNFKTLSPNFINRINVAVGHDLIKLYQFVVTSKNSRKESNLSTVTASLSPFDFISASASRNIPNVGSISRRFLSSNTTRNISHGSFIDSK